MDILILMFLALIVIFAVGLLTIFKNRKPSQKKEGPAPAPAPAEARVEPGARRRALAANRNARIRQRVVVEEDNDSETEAPVIELPEGKIGAKKMAKLQAKAERKAQRESEEKLRQEKKKAQELAEKERKNQELKEKEEENKRLEEEKRIKEEIERKEYEEYLKLKEAFSIQEEGFEESEESEVLLQDFINHVKTNKIVVLEDIAAQFKLKTQDVINRINSLQAEGQLTGVIDDRGKFIYITPDELDAVAKFVKQRGRVSIVELVENSNMLIDLTPAA